ncbi:hypothetical protein EN781_09770 [Mesorhizobium sp. M4A.F.Ca.ET.090.04.2.1]|uniref:hypothetical protein n=1 Tax=Mesorhizobium sp. M4A.F.Ca.ET.090.04.2.1 TaxID=2496663 RepID=UPI000FCC8F0A|nr:hypothetical protein [Mesorhizobium sp. M4A.F.Ca.ET.090.04.2.1]RVC45473.1 hypothetical protein EN781_09770 [Mesorhizobium sp. M4A.F.Ca.ET.090.04.2.1]
MTDENLPHIDAVSGQAAWALVQLLAMRLVHQKIIPKKVLQEDVAMAVQHHRAAPGLNPAQRAAAHLLAQFQTLLHTADRSDAH